MVTRWSVGRAPAISCLLVVGALARGGITGSAHDFRSAGWSDNEICRPCHTPHAANTQVSDAPLWNHAVTTTTYILYSSPSLRGTPEQPRGRTKFCLSCHDGTVALDKYGTKTGSTFMTGSALLGTNLADDHPVSIRWQHQGGGNLNCMTCHNFGRGPDPALPFFDGYVECATCHDAHNNVPHPRFLRLPLTKSQICFHCHAK